MDKNDGMNYAPVGNSEKVVKSGEFIFSVIGLDHGHINGMTNGLKEAGATLKYVYDPDPVKVDTFVTKNPEAIIAESEEQVLFDSDTKLVAGACITSERAELGIRVMSAGKDYFTDKAPFTTLEQIDKVRQKIADTKRKYAVYYSELCHVEGAEYAKQLVKDGKIGKVLQVIGLGPHRLNAPGRPEWFFDKDKFGGILCDIGSHNIYQFLEFCDINNAKVISSTTANYNNSHHPKFDDFGDANLVGEDGTTHYLRVDWFTPDGLSTWGDGRLIILGTEGYIEVRKYVDVASESKGDNVILVNNNGEFFENVNGKYGFPFFSQLILDCINRTELSQSQDRAIKATELAIIAQKDAIRLTS